jgi:hypothetical protein
MKCHSKKTNLSYEKQDHHGPAFLFLRVPISAIYFNFLSPRIFMISNCYLDSEGESAWQDSPL